MTNTADALGRLIDLPGVRDLEFRAVLKRDFAGPEARAEFPEINACAGDLFGLNADEAEAVTRPDGWDLAVSGRKRRAGRLGRQARSGSQTVPQALERKPPRADCANHPAVLQRKNGGRDRD